MVVCSCNVIRDADIRRALDHGTETVSGIYRACGCAAQCGACAAAMKAALRAARGRRMDAGTAD